MGLLGRSPRPASPLGEGDRAPAPGWQRLCPGTGTEEARQTGAKNAVSFGAMWPRRPLLPQGPSPGRGAALAADPALLPATLAQFRQLLCRCPCLIPLSFCPPTGGQDRTPTSRGMLGSGGAGTGAGVAGGRGSGPAQAACPTPGTLREIPAYSGHLAEFWRYLQGVCRET